MQKNPFTQFADWFREAQRSRAIEDATAFCVSTIDPSGLPNARMVLLKGFDERGFVFYTNLHSTKGKSLQKVSRAALTFYWAPLKKQVRIQGKTQIVSNQEADIYWKSRGRQSQLGAWASRQSEILPHREILLKEISRFARKFQGRLIPRPSYWTGVRVIPQKMEFWIGGAHRIHDRFLYTKMSGRWKIARLYP